MAYLSMMAIVWVVMNVLGEMSTYLPLKGISIPYYVSRFVEPSLAFAAGYNYWYAYAMLVASEVTAGAIILQYWTDDVPVAVWIAIQLIVILLLNIFAVALFGEAEFWFASIKLITIMGLIILGLVIMLGGGPNHQRLGFYYWQEPGAFIPFLRPGDTGRFLGYWYAFIKAGFAFITSPELVALSAGETVAPRRNIPKAARRFVWRLAVFYGLGSLIIGVIVPSNEPGLLSGASNAAASPFVLGIQNAGIGGLNHVINAAVLTSAWSAGNAFCYSGSRVLYSMAANGQAPRIFTKTTKRGVPYAAVLLTLAFGCLGFLNVSNSGATVFGWFTNISTISGFIAWIVVLVTYIRFRAAAQLHGVLAELPFKTPLQPWASYVALLVVSLLTITNGFPVFFPGRWSASDFLAAYITLPVFLVLYLGHKLVYRTPLARPLNQIDVITGKKEMDEMEAMEAERVPRNWVEKAWHYIA